MHLILLQFDMPRGMVSMGDLPFPEEKEGTGGRGGGRWNEEKGREWEERREEM